MRSWTRAPRRHRARSVDAVALGYWFVCASVTFLGAGLLYFTAQELPYPDWARFALPAVAMVAAALVMLYMLFKTQQHG